MKQNNKEIEKYRVKKGPFGTTEKYGNNGLFEIPFKQIRLRIMISDELNWDHVSVTIIGKKYKCASWAAMCFVKDLFFDETETVIQYHPAKDSYINNHPGCLHLWRPQNKTIELPPREFV